jgi:uncharacterized protein
VIFLDTGPLLARRLPRDSYHERALLGWDRWAKTNERLVTSNFILGELSSLLSRRAGMASAIDYWRDLLEAPRLDIVRPSTGEEILALQLMEKIGNPEIGYTDYLSFALMRKRQIRRAFTFDAHFTAAGFEIWE